MEHIVPLYHGTSREAASRLVRFREGDELRSAPGSWFGPGLYFWEADEEAAWSWARHHHEEDAAVLSMNLPLRPSDGLDLTTMRGRREYAQWCAMVADEPSLASPSNADHAGGSGELGEATVLRLLTEEMKASWIRALVFCTDRD